MTTPQTIVCPTDFSECSRWALDRAATMALRYNAQLHVLHVRTLFFDPGPAAEEFPEVEQYQRLLESLATEEMNQLGLQPHTSITKRIRRSVTAADGILDYAQEQNADLIVLGTHGRRGLRHVLLGSVAERVARLSSCSVLTVGQTPKHESNKIIVPLDFSEASCRAFEYAARIAEKETQELVLLHIANPEIFPRWFVAGPRSVFEVFPTLERETREQLRAIADRKPSLRIENVIGEGSVYQKITECALEHGANLIVMGATGQGGAKKSILGGVTEKVIRTASCPVLVTRDKQEPGSEHGARHDP